MKIYDSFSQLMKAYSLHAMPMIAYDSIKLECSSIKVPNSQCKQLTRTSQCFLVLSGSSVKFISTHHPVPFYYSFLLIASSGVVRSKYTCCVHSCDVTKQVTDPVSHWFDIGQLFAVGPDFKKGYSQLDRRGERFLETTVHG